MSASRLRIEYLPLTALQPYDRNARTHSADQVAQLVASVRAFGWTNPILVDERNLIIAGHGRLAAATELGLAEVPVIRLEGLDDAHRRALAIADNKLAMNAGWDEKLLVAELGGLGELQGLVGFSADELLRLLGGNQGRTDPDEVPPVPAEPITRPGDLWLLGPHRLLCGDATSAADVGLLLGDSKPRLMVTDPPYGVALDMEWRDRACRNTLGPAEPSYMRPRNGAAHQALSISGDTRADWSEAFALVPSLTVAYVWHATSHSIDVGLGLQNIDFQIRQQIIWVKPVFVISRQAYNWQHEPCWYAVRKGATATWKGGHSQSTLWEAASPKMIFSGSKEEKVNHPTQKPVALYNRPIENHTDIGDTVYEPFSGSGSAIIAGEGLTRQILAMEIDPVFVDVAVQRWENFTGQKAERQAAHADAA
jgi:DNA modification methylase